MPPERPPPHPTPDAGLPRRNWLRRGLITAALIALFLGLGVSLLPSLLSAGWFRELVLARTSQALGRSVELDELRVGWSGRLLLRGLRVSDLPEYSPEPLLALDRLEVSVAPWALLRSRLTLDLALSGLRVQVVRDAGGRTNLQTLAGASPALSEAPRPRAAPADRRLPLRAISVRVRLGGVEVRVEDRQSGRAARVREGTVRVDLPSLDAPLTASVSAGLELDGVPVPPLALDLQVERWSGDRGLPPFSGAAGWIEARLPGLELAAAADLAAATARARVGVDLAGLLRAAAPFLPPSMALETANGTLVAELSGQGRPGEAISWAGGLEGSALRARGPLLGEGRALGPIDLRLKARGRADPARGDVEVEDGRVALQEDTRLDWRAKAEGLGTAAARVEAVLGPAAVSLDELLALGADFLPEDLALRLAGGRFRLERAELRGPVPAEGAHGLAHTLAARDLEVAADAFEAAAPGTRARGAGLRLGIESLEVALLDFLPRSGGFVASLTAGSLEVVEPLPLRLEGFRVAELQGSFSDALLGPGGPLARGEVRETLAMDSLEIPGVGRLSGLAQSAALVFSLGPGGEVAAALEDFFLRMAAAEGEGEGTSIALAAAGTVPAVEVQVRRAAVSGPLAGSAPPSGPVSAEADGLALSLGAVRAASGDRAVRGRALRAEVVSLRALLREGVPEAAALRARAEAAEVVLEGPEGVALRGIDVPEVAMEASGLRPSERALFGISGEVELAQQLTLGEAVAPGRGRMEGLRQKLRGTLRLDPGPTAAVSGGRLAVQAAGAEARFPEGIAGPVALRLEAAWDALRLTSAEPGAPLQVDLEGLRAEAGAGEFFRAALRASAQDLGAQGLTTAGEARLDLAGAATAVPPALLPGTLTGALSASWDLEGRLPTPEETGNTFSDPGAWAYESPLPFLRRASARVALEAVGAQLTLERGETGGRERLAVAGVGTPEPLWIVAEDNGRRVKLGGQVAAGWVEEVPGLGSLEEQLGEPLRLRLGFGAERGPEGTLEVSQFFEAEPLALRQDAELRLTGLDNWLRQGTDAPPALWLGLLGGRGRVGVRLGADPRLAGLASQGAGFRGPLEAGAEVTLVRGEEVSAEAFLRAEGASLGWGETAAAEGLTAAVALEKRYALRRVAADTPSPAPWLSQEVLGPAGRALAGADRPFLSARYGGESRLGLTSLRWTGGPLPLEARNLLLEFGLPGGLLWAERFEAGLLGGSAVGSFGVQARPAGGFEAVARLAFTGLDAARLAPKALGDEARGTDTELSGRLELTIPLETDARALLGAARVEAELTRIGSGVLDRALYALDPTESNEAVVRQRRLVRRGGPRWVRVEVRDGNLSLEGEVEAAGVRLALPRLDRLRVAELPGVEGLQDALGALGPVLGALEAARADVLAVDDAGAMKFERGGLP